MQQKVTTLIEIDPSIITNLVQKVEELTELVKTTKKKEFEGMVSAKTAAKLFNCTEKAIYSYNLPKYRIQGLIRYKISDLEKMIEPA